MTRSSCRGTRRGWMRWDALAGEWVIIAAQRQDRTFLPPPEECPLDPSREGRLTEIPMKAAKRRIVLERIALEFEPGVHYDEREVNAIVGRFFNDHAAIRRYLVDERFLDRDHGVYWRSGGRVEV